jgi:hypothetical protein
MAVCLTGTLRAGASAGEPLELQMLAPPGCPARHALEANILRDLPPDRATEERLRVQLLVSEEGPGAWKAILKVENAGGSSERVLGAESCDALFNVISLVLATMLDPGADHPPIEAESSSESRADSTETPGAVSNADTSAILDKPQPPTPTSPLPKGRNTARPVAASPPTKQAETDTAAATGDEPPVPKSSGSLLLALWGALDSGSLSAVTAAVGGALGYDHENYRVEATLGWWWPRAEAVGPLSSALAGGEFGMTAGGAKACLGIWRSTRGVFGPCGGFEVERWQAQGDVGVANRRTSHLWGGGVNAGVEGRVALDEVFALRVTVEALWLINPPAFGFNDNGSHIEAFRPNTFVMRMGTGVEAHFR